MTQQPLCFQFDDVRVDLASARAWKAQKPLAIEPKAFRVLVYLLENRGRLIEKDELLSTVWSGTFVTENALTRAIAQLRKALGDSKSDAKYIETVPTRGYRFIAVADLSYGRPGQENEVSRTLLSSAPSPPATASQIARLALPAVLAAGVLTAAFWVAVAKRPASAGSPAPLRMQATSSAGMDIFPSFSPDGSAVAYSSDVDGRFEIYLKQLTRGGSVVQLTKDGGPNLQPAWSPDGKTIAFHSLRHGGIWLVPALGGAFRQLTTFGSGPVWSPDGSQIVFQSEAIRDLSATADVSIASSTIWTVSVFDGAAHPLTQVNKPQGAHNSPTWSPDGKSIAFTVSEFDSDAGLWTMRADGSEQTRLISGGSLYNPRYSHDGNFLYIGGMRQKDFAIWKIPVGVAETEIADSTEKIVSTFPSVPRYLAVSPDGNALAYSDVRTTSELYSIALSPKSGEAVGAPSALTRDTRFRKAMPRFSPDGKHILFDVGSASFESGVWVMDADGSNATQIAGKCASPAWLPGGQEFVCWSFDASRPGKVLVRYRLDSKIRQPVRPLPDAEMPFLAASPDGESVVFTAARNGASNLWLTAMDGGDSRQITFDPELAGFPSFSPDGKQIAFEQKRADVTNVMVMPSSGGSAIQLTHDLGQSWPHSWSPDSRRVTFAGLRNGVWNIWTVATDTRQERPITTYNQMNHYVRYPAWSPDGTRIVYEYGETKANVWIVALN